MASEADETLRESARHRGLTLIKSRRRKPGGDFGKYGLKDASGRELFGFGEAGLSATAAEIEAYLRGATRSEWKEAATGLPKRRPPKTPKAPPRPKPKALAIGHLWRNLPSARRGEVFTELVAKRGVRIERIVSLGQTTPEAEPLVQKADEWVIVLQGRAAIRLDGYAEAELTPGDHLLIPGGTRHWVTRTDPDAPTLWLAIHIE